MADEENQQGNESTPSEKLQIPPISKEAAGAATGAVVGSVIGPVGAVIGGVIGAAVGRSAGSKNTAAPVKRATKPVAKKAPRPPKKVIPGWIRSGSPPRKKRESRIRSA